MSTNSVYPTPKVRDRRKIIVALQFWQGDRDRAMHLAELIASLEPTKNPLVDFAFVSRFDTTLEGFSIEKVSRKFDVWTLKGTRRGTGWPAGCNDLALDLLQQSAARCRKGGVWANHKALYLIESDVMPMCRDWLARLSDEWDVAQEAGKMIMGAWSPFHSAQGHINGNMFVRPDLTFKIPGLESCPNKAGWDCYFGDKFAPHWYKSRTMKNTYDYRTNIPEEILFASVDGITPPVVNHGTKDFSAEMQLRGKLFGPG